MSTCGFSALSLPSRGAFHLSLTVLVHYRSPSVFSLGRWSSQLPTGFLVSRGTHAPDAQSQSPFAYRALTVSGHAFQLAVRLDAWFLTLRSRCRSLPIWSFNPTTDFKVDTRLVGPGLGSSPVARRYWGNPSLFLAVLRCFSSGSALRPVYGFNRRYHPLPGDGLPHSEIVGSPRGCSLPDAFRSCPRPSSALDA